VSLKVYGYKNCDTCRKAAKWLESRGVKFKEIPIRETPPTVAELKKMLKAHDGDMRKLFNTSGTEYKALGMKDKLPDMSEADALALLASNGFLVKRPFVLGDGVATVGFKEEAWAEVFGKG